MTDQEKEIKRVISYIRSCRDAGIDTTITIDKTRNHFILNALEEIQQYRAIGTIEECREAKERQRGKKPIEYEDKYYACPTCDNVLMHKWGKYPSQLKDKKCGLPYCLSCGQAIDWSDTD